ncbi:MAG: succinyl-diaminopimelate desuccinylase [Alphaproteobacteria bacterium]|nr:succinyl-diaminopimelate desuccinylase [Alphaproteobacteria bacterium]
MSSTPLDPVSLTQEQIRFESVTPHDKGAQAHLKTYLQKMGFTIYDLPFEGNGGTYPVQNFFARLGSTGPHICYAGHTDVVPAGDVTGWTYAPFGGEIANGKIYGRGACDMKGGNCAFLAAVSRYLTHSKTPGSISFLITGDEEAESVNGTVRVLQWMSHHGHIPDVCLVGEPSNPSLFGESVRVGRRGSLNGHLVVTGKQGHVANPHFADNPVPKLIRLLSALTSHVFDTGNAFFPATNLEITTVDVGNTAMNIIPAKAEAYFNIRFNDQWTSDSLKQKIHALLNQAHVPYDVRLWGNAESFRTPPGSWVDLVLSVIREKTGQNTQGNTGGGTSDARFISRYCPVVEFGALSKTIHHVDEHIDIDILYQLTDIYHEIIVRYFKMT